MPIVKCGLFHLMASWFIVKADHTSLFWPNGETTFFPFFSSVFISPLKGVGFMEDERGNTLFALKA